MKKTHRAIFLPAVILSMLSIAGFSHAQVNPGDLIHLPNDGDKLHPNVSFSKSAISNVDDGRKCVSFNLELFAPSDDADVSVYVDGDTVSYVQFATKQIFRITPVAFEYLGYDNRAGDFRLETPTGVRTPDAVDSLPLSSKWEGRLMLHGKAFLKEAKGISSSSAERGWNIAGDTDTIRNATLVRWDLTLAYIDNDSINQNISDTIATERISDYQLPIDRVMSERLLTRREMWFAEDARYPVLQRSRMFRLIHDENEVCDTIPLSSFSSYYPAAYQYSDTGDESMRRSPEKNANPWKNSSDTRMEAGLDGMTISEASSDGRDISVTLSSESGESDLSLTLYTDSCIRLTETTRIKVGTLPRTHTIPIPSGVKGVVILLIESDNGTTSRKVIL
ncbi:MAG: hypothetical protein NC095_09435 [Muribaculum sp.]|nr:hypothetical protein [Muribaculum sp.]